MCFSSSYGPKPVLQNGGEHNAPILGQHSGCLGINQGLREHSLFMAGRGSAKSIGKKKAPPPNHFLKHAFMLLLCSHNSYNVCNVTFVKKKFAK